MQKEARTLWRALHNLPMLADNLTSSAGTLYLAGKFDTAMALAQEALEVSRSIGSLWGQACSLGIIGPLYLAVGQVDKGLQALEDSIPIAEDANFIIPLNARVLLSWLHGMLGNLEYAFELVNTAQEKVSGVVGYRPHILAVQALLHTYSGYPAKGKALIDEGHQELDAAEGIAKIAFEWFLYMIEAEVLLANQNYNQALDLITQTIDMAQNIGIRPFLPVMLRLKGEALLALGHTTQAHQTLLEGLAQAKTLYPNPNPLTIPLLIALNQLEAQLGNPTQAQARQAETRQAIEFMVDHLPPKLRATLLALPFVREALENT